MDTTADGRSAGPIPERVLDSLREAAGANGWTDAADVMAPHLVEQRGLYRGATPLMLRPDSVDRVAAILRICNAARVPVVPQGGNTGLVAGGIPDEGNGQILLSLSRLDRIREIDPFNHTLVAEAGCILETVQNAAADEDLLFPLSLGAEGSCEIGGNISTNAGGVAVLRYGNMRDLVLGLEVVLADGTVWNGLTGLRKDNTGYDLKQLFIGAEGTLGVVTAAVLKLFPRPRDKATAFVALRDLPATIEVLARARAASGDLVTAYEYMARIGLDLALAHIEGVVDPLGDRHDHYALIEFTASASDLDLGARLEAFLADAFERGLVRDAAIAQNEAQAASFWRMREAIPEAQRFEGGSIKHDVSVPVSRVADFIERASAACIAELDGLRPVPFGHVGDGNIHFNLTQPMGMEKQAFLDRWAHFNRIVHDIVRDLDGSLSAEHGIGRLKREELAHYASPVKLDLMRKLKVALDPNNIMNPGKIL